MTIRPIQWDQWRPLSLRMTQDFQVFVLNQNFIRHDTARLTEMNSQHSLSHFLNTTQGTEIPSYSVLCGFTRILYSCYHNGSLTLLFLPISRHSRNILHAPGQAASISITSEKLLARNPRVALIGNVTIFKDATSIPDFDYMKRCYLSKHQDAKWWLPGDDEAAHLVSVICITHQTT